MSLLKVRDGLMLNPFILDIIFLSDPFFHIRTVIIIDINIAMRDTIREVAERAIKIVIFLSTSSLATAGVYLVHSLRGTAVVIVSLWVIQEAMLVVSLVTIFV